MHFEWTYKRDKKIYVQAVLNLKYLEFFDNCQLYLPIPSTCCYPNPTVLFVALVFCFLFDDGVTWAKPFPMGLPFWSTSWGLARVCRQPWSCDDPERSHFLYRFIRSCFYPNLCLRKNEWSVILSSWNADDPSRTRWKYQKWKKNCGRCCKMTADKCTTSNNVMLARAWFDEMDNINGALDRYQVPAEMNDLLESIWRSI